jgi:folate-binding protein YgfZ
MPKTRSEAVRSSRLSTIVGVIATSEYELVTESAGLVDRSDRAKFLVRGGEAAEFLQGQVSNDVEALLPGRGCYSVILNHKGKLRTDLRVLRGEGFFWLDTEPIGHAVLAHMLGMYTVGRDVEWQDVTATRALVSVIGPASRELFDGPEHFFEEREGRMYVATALGVDVIGERDLELPYDSVSEEAAECVRIESGRPRLGYDMDAQTMPQEAGINERAVSFTKGCYVGQETVARLHYRGKPNRHLRGLRLSEPAERGTDIMLEDRAVGRLGSVCVSPRLGPIALALVRREAAPGDKVTIAGADAEVVALPFEAD